jgi:amidase
MKADEMHYRSIVEVSGMLGRRELTSLEITQAMLDRIGKLDGALHGYATVLGARALARAEKCDREIRNGVRRGPLHGIPIAHAKLKELLK